MKSSRNFGGSPAPNGNRGRAKSLISSLHAIAILPMTFYSPAPFDLEDYEMATTSVSAAPVDMERSYGDWLAKGKALSDSHSNNQWSIGDWLIEGESEFDFAGIIPGHLLIHKKNDGSGECFSEKIPNFWKDAAAETGNAVSTLKEFVKVARAFPPADRVRQLSFTHHLYAAPYDRRAEYLAACVVEGERPKSVAWLDAHIQEKEGGPEIEDEKPGAYHVRFPVPDEMWAKLKNLSKHYKTNVPALVQKSCAAALEQFIAEQAEVVSLQKFGFYEGEWPFYRDSTSFNKAEREKANKEKKSRRRKRMVRDPEFSEKRRAAAHIRWMKSGERVA
jgi:hypothetical protein